MTEKEAIHVLETIQAIYPKFDISKTKAKLLIPKLCEMDHAGVMDKLTAHTMHKPYAPTLEEIAVYPPEKNDYLEMVQSWRREAILVPEATKQHFYQKIQQLTREKNHE